MCKIMDIATNIIPLKYGTLRNLLSLYTLFKESTSDAGALWTRKYSNGI